MVAGPAAARDSLGVYEGWAAFTDPRVPRCYAIASAEAGGQRKEVTPYVTVGTWPRRGVRGQFHVRLSRTAAPARRVSLTIGDRRFDLAARGRNAWLSDPNDGAAIRAALRSAQRMSVSATDRRGQRFTDRYTLRGAASAMDAATLDCARFARK